MRYGSSCVRYNLYSTLDVAALHVYAMHVRILYYTNNQLCNFEIPMMHIHVYIWSICFVSIYTKWQLYADQFTVTFNMTITPGGAKISIISLVKWRAVGILEIPLTCQIYPRTETWKDLTIKRRSSTNMWSTISTIIKLITIQLYQSI